MATQSRIDAAVEALRTGRFVLVVDDSDREDEGDLVIGAQFVTSADVGFLLEHTSGVICVALEPGRCDGLDLEPMASRNTAPLQTAFTVSVDAAVAVGTGISAADRAQTIRILADPGAIPADLVRPGHVFPLRAAAGGLTERRGHTEACVELAHRAGIEPAVVLCEVTSADRMSMAGGRELRELAARHDIPLVHVADLAAHPVAPHPAAAHPVAVRAARSATARPRRSAAAPLSAARLPTRYGTMTAYAFASDHLALVHGDVTSAGPVPVRLHSECITGDLVGSARCDCGEQLDLALRSIAAAGLGVLIYLRGHEGRGIGLANKLRAYALQDEGLDTVDANLHLGLPVDARDYGDAADILRALGVGAVQLLTNNPDKVRALRDRGLTVTRRPLAVLPGPENGRYLRTKANRLGHDLVQRLACAG